MKKFEGRIIWVTSAEFRQARRMLDAIKAEKKLDFKDYVNPEQSLWKMISREQQFLRIKKK